MSFPSLPRLSARPLPLLLVAVAVIAASCGSNSSSNKPLTSRRRLLTPLVIGLPPKEATNRLIASGFRVRQIGETGQANVVVVRQRPAAGAPAAPNQVVILRLGMQR